MTTTPWDEEIARLRSKGYDHMTWSSQDKAEGYRQGYAKRAEEDEARYQKLVEACEEIPNSSIQIVDNSVRGLVLLEDIEAIRQALADLKRGGQT